ncbi:MAG TPA: ABC transporter permease [Pyrinomonadaceae bacterium]|nr:ABC transporter permease [Pyrinomonadaceae bacterium]
MDTLIKDIRFGIRSLLRRPGFTAIAVTTLAVGIGINAALFSVVNGVLLNPLPFPQPEQLVTIDQSKPNFETGAVPYPNFLDLRKENQTFSAMSIFRAAAFSLIDTGDPERVNGRFVSAGFCSVFGITPVVGRGFLPHEDEPGVTPTVLISHDLWQRKFAGDRNVINRTITLDDKSYYVIGVLPAEFRFFQTGDVFVPIGQLDAAGLKRRGAGMGLHGIGRLKPGVTVEQGRADLNRIMQNLAVTYPETNKGNGAAVGSLKQRIVGDIGPTLWMLLGAVAFVLLIACVNVGNLMLARASGRAREFAIRAALGAGWWRLVRQSLTESLLLSFTGGALGVFVAYSATHAALSLLPTTLPRAQEVRIDYRVLLFALGISLLSGILAGLAPALRNSRFADALKESGRGNTGARSRAQATLVAVEVALAVVLLIGGGLMIRSIRALWNIDPGFRSDDLLTFGLSLAPSTRNDKPEAIRANLRQLSDRLNSMPGVKAVSLQSGAFPLLDEDDTLFWIEGEPKPTTGSDMHATLTSAVEPTYLTAMGMPLKQGRFFDNHDDEHAPWVVVVDEVFANKFFPGVNPIGKRIRQGDDDPQTIIGVVGHVKHWGLDSDDTQSLRAQMYEPLRQFPDPAVPGFAAGVRVVLRGPVSQQQIDSIRSLVKSLNGQNIIYNPQTMNESIAGSLSSRRFAMVLLDSFAVLALFMASLGLYGVISYLVERRTQELGIRIALGAQSWSVLRLVLRDGLRMALAGVGVGLLAAFGLTRLLAKMVYGVSTTDPATFIAISCGLTLVALLACYFPARRATKVDPLVALRYE